jgi:alpha-mannosidase
LHRYVSLFALGRGATVYSDGLAEYEATRSGDVYVTLLRAVGELSRNDLEERPGHAGWPTPTPGAQSHGPFEARLAVLLHESRSDETITLVEQTADDVLLPLVGETLRSALEAGLEHRAVELHGDGLAFSALKERENGKGIVARCMNLLDREVAGTWSFGGLRIHSATLARLDETPLEPLAVRESGRVPFVAGPRAVVTILVD